MPKTGTEFPTLSGNAELQRRAERARETERLAQEADAEANRLRKQMKRARKAYKKAKQAATEATKTASKARSELSGCLDGAFRQLAALLQEDAQAPVSAKPPAPAPDDPPGKVEVLLLPKNETQERGSASG